MAELWFATNVIFKKIPDVVVTSQSIAARKKLEWATHFSLFFCSTPMNVSFTHEIWDAFVTV